VAPNGFVRRVEVLVAEKIRCGAGGELGGEGIVQSSVR